ncbi:MAG: ATP-binding protein [Bacteriovoracaceae bacterium]
MKFWPYFRFFILSILGALTLSLISLFFLIRISDMVVEDYRYGYLLYMARAIEKSSDYQPVSKININKYPAPPAPKDNSILKIAEFGPQLINDTNPEIIKDFDEAFPDIPRRLKSKMKGVIFEKKGPKPSLWLVSNDGKIISSNTIHSLPIKWEDLPHPKKIHGIRSNENPLFEPKTFIVRLDTDPITFLVLHNERSLFQGPYLWIQGMHTFTTAALAVFLALSISFYYLRRKSLQARKVLSKLESGDLKARFEVKRFDEFGSLILDFNRMADEIERLVKKLNDTEASRSNLLQELGHDLRTPLTSLSTSFETLQLHNNDLSEEDRMELFSIVSADILYFRDLLEKLTIVATIDEPHYKASTETIDLSSLIHSEIKLRQSSSSSEGIKWSFNQNVERPEYISGDSHLITRLFKNAFDNAARFAQKSIDVNLKVRSEQIEVLICDDGPGLTVEAIESFAKRRERRLRKDKGPNDFSLGLGSVIMKTIAEVHGGSIEIKNIFDGTEIKGAKLKVIFKRSNLNRKIFLLTPSTIS